MAIELSSLLQESAAARLASEDRSSVVSMNLFVALLCVCIIVGHLLEQNRWLNESITALAIGLLSGVLILFISGWKRSRLLSFNEHLFFNYLLPPIIFNAGFEVKKKEFFRNLNTIVLYGVFGTLISFGVISLGAMQIFQKMNVGPLSIGDFLAIGAIFSATDSVCTLQVLKQDNTPFLHSLVFGEGIVNDATSVVLFNAIQKFDSRINSVVAFELLEKFIYLFIKSTLLGAIAGLLSAYVIKKIYQDRHAIAREVALTILMAYSSYLVAELFNLSAIITVFVCGVVISHYAWNTLNVDSRVTTKNTIATLSFIAELFIFLYVGMDALDIEKWRIGGVIFCFFVGFYFLSPGTPIGVSAVLLALVLVGRAAFVFPISFLSNLTKDSPFEKVCFEQQVTIWWSGLMRGAVSMALTYNHFSSSTHAHSHRNAIMITSTITVVIFSTTVFGLLTKPLVRLLVSQSKPSSVLSSEEEPIPNSLTESLLDTTTDPETLEVAPTSPTMVLNTPSHTVHCYWRRLDDRFMRTVFGVRGFSPLE